MNIITNDNSFKNHAKFMPDIVNILHKHAKIFQESLQDSCKYQSRILPNLVRYFARFISCQFLP